MEGNGRMDVREIRLNSCPPRRKLAGPVRAGKEPIFSVSYKPPDTGCPDSAGAGVYLFFERTRQ